jgi:hypothetical protein
VVAFGIIASVSNNTAKLDSFGSHRHQVLELINVWLGTAPTREGEDEVVTSSADDRQLGVVAVSHCFPGIFYSISTFDEITAGRGTLQSG